MVATILSPGRLVVLQIRPPAVIDIPTPAAIAREGDGAGAGAGSGAGVGAGVWDLGCSATTTGASGVRTTGSSRRVCGAGAGVRRGDAFGGALAAGTSAVS